MDPGQARVGSPARGRAGLGFPEAAFYLPSKADGDRDGKAGPRVAPSADGDARGWRSILFLPPASRPGPCAGGARGAGHAKLPRSGFRVGASPRPRAGIPGSTAAPQPRTGLGPRTAPPPRRSAAPPRRSLAACTRQPRQPATYLGGPKKLCWHHRAPARETSRQPALPPIPRHLKSQPGEADLAASLLRMRVPRTDNRSLARSKSLFLPTPAVLSIIGPGRGVGKLAELGRRLGSPQHARPL